jgi:aspartate aminotransferase-like enzyme
MIMTPGPTYVSEDVRRALSMEITNPDLDPEFFEFYKETCEKIQQFLKTKNEVLILCGEGILGLEAACASLIEPGDRVLCIDNGIFGKGFGDFQSMYGAEVVYFKSDYRKAIDVDALREFLKKDNNFKMATVVHCETPSGITNPVDLICPLLKEYNILTVVDSVYAMGGEPLEVDKWKIDIVVGGSQKCISAPPGLTLLSVSRDAWDKILNRKVPVGGFYVNLSIWVDWYKSKWFPYTQPISDIYALRKAIERLLEEGEAVIERHSKIANAVRRSLTSSGLELFPLSGFSNTVTTVKIPDGITFKELFNEMLKKHGIMIAGAFGFLKDKVFRIGHMGENCYEEKVYITLKALDEVLRSHGIKLKEEIHIEFVKNIK